MPYPTGLRVHEHLPPAGREGPDGPPVVLVHGSLDRAASFTRTVRRLDDLVVVTYDRRGYGGSRAAAGPAGLADPAAGLADPAPGLADPAPGLADHVADLLAVVEALPGTGPPATAVGHSLGGDVVIAAALARPALFASIGAYEPPMPWLGLTAQGRRPRQDGWPPPDVDPAAEAERFFRRMVGDDAWDRLPPATRQERRSEGPALVADLTAIRGPAPFDVTRLAVAALFGRGGAASEPHHREVPAWLAAHVPGAELFDIDAAGHGVHLTHPDAFAAFVRRAVALSAGTAPAGTATAGAPAPAEGALGSPAR